MDTAALDDTRLRRLLAVGRSLVGELDPERLLDDVLTAAQELTGARFAALGVLDERRRELARFLTRGIAPEAQRAIGDLPRGRGVLGALIDDPRPLRIERLQDHPSAFGFPPGHPPMASFLGVPIVVRGETWGTIYLTEKPSGPFDAGDEQALVVLADWAAVAIGNARLYDQLQRRHDEIARANHVLGATTTIARAIGAETDLGRILDLIASRGRALAEARTTLILLPRDRSANELEIAAIAGERGDAAPGARFPRAGSTTDDVLRDGRPRRMRADALGISPARLGFDGARSSLMVPLIFGDRRLGVLLALDPLDGDAFGPQQEELLMAMATSAATAIVTAQSVSEQRLRDALDSAEQERRRWARELHDETLQGLGGLQVRLSVAEQRSPDEATRSAIGEVLDALGGEIRKLRTLITELRPAALDELGLAPALDSLARGVAASSGIAIDARIDLPRDRLDPLLETSVYRIVQESLTNVVKHAGASRCEIAVCLRDGHVELSVLDDGRGVDDSGLERRTGFGVTGMRERAQLAGGSLELGRDRSGGTMLRARLPATRRDGSR